MDWFVDEYERVLDDKGRIILPAKVREGIGTSVYITPALSDKCLHIYTEQEWTIMSEKLKKLPTTTDKNAAMFVRRFFGRASLCEVDKQGRINLADRHIKYAELKKDVVLVGANSRLELWDASIFAEVNANAPDDETIIIEGVEKYGLNF